MQTSLTSNATADFSVGATAPPAVSSAEARFERGRRTIGLFAGPIAFLLLLITPLPGLSGDAARLLAVMGLVVTWWVTEAIPVPATALVGTSLAVLCGIAPATAAFSSYASPTIFLFMGSFMIAQAIAEHGLDKRLALALINVPALAGHPKRLRAAIGMLTLLISGWMSNTATTAMMIPIALGVLGASRAERAASYRPSVVLTVAYAASIGGMMTPVGSPPNLITLGQLEKIANVQVDFVSWMLLAAPISIVYGLVLCFVLPQFLDEGRSPRLSCARTPPVHVAGWTQGQVNCAIAFAVAVWLWVVPGLLAIWAAPGDPVAVFASRLDEGVVAVAAASLLFVMPVDWKQRTFTLNWHSASKIDWGTILLFGGGLSLGQMMFSTGLAAYIGEGLVRLSGAESLWAITAVATLVALALSEITSNTAAAAMLLPVVLSIAAAAGVNPVPPAIGTCLGASLAFMFPISTPPNALAYGTGLVPITLMMRYGLVMDVIGFGIIMAGLRILCPILGYA